ncbi:MAG: ATP-binding cassette domain-containing protein [Phenylobacterium sp.]|uniref:ATP-binding cassette domain-containing protein n=1 Tax=Phenylobacterium sp. TaxID=1871053 RepID=UPI003918CE82
MSRTDEAADRRRLAQWAREAPGAPAPLLALLTLVDAAGAAGFAAALVAVLATPHKALGLAGVAAAMAVRAAASWISARLCARHARAVTTMVRRKVVGAALSRRRGARTALGEAMAAAVEEVEALEGYYARYRPAQLAAGLGPMAICAAAAFASPVAAAILLATLLPFAAIMALAGSAAAGEARRQFEALARLSGLFVDRVRALPVVLAFQAEGRETARVGQAAREVGERTLGVLRIAFVSTAALEFFAALSVALVAVYAGFSLLGVLPFRAPETLDFPRAFFVLALAPEVYAPMRRLAAAYHERQIGEAAAGRLGSWAAQAAAPPPARPVLAAPPSVVLRGASLAFGERRIGPVDAVCPAGCLTAVVGPTGSGKTSLMEAIVGLTPLAAGDIEVGGASLRAGGGFAADAAWAGQAPALLPGSILDNLVAAGPGVTRDDALAMAVKVGLGPALERRPQGAETPVDERGSGLSGGERRRLALARALLKPAPLLLLDEPTADLDPAAEAELVRLIRAAVGSHTVIVATHSPALAEAADHVVRLS